MDAVFVNVNGSLRPVFHKFIAQHSIVNIELEYSRLVLFKMIMYQTEGNPKHS